MGKAHDAHLFLDAIQDAYLLTARALLPRIDWSLFDEDANPVKSLFNSMAWAPSSANTFLSVNRVKVANAVFEDFDFKNYSVVDTDGWTYGVGNDLKRIVYLESPDHENGLSGDSIKCHFDVAFEDRNWNVADISATIARVGALGRNHIGGFAPCMDTFAATVATSIPYDEMPAFAMEVLQWCADNRPDLLRDPYVVSPVTSNGRKRHPIYSCVVNDLASGVVLCLEHGGDLHAPVPGHDDSAFEEAQLTSRKGACLPAIRSFLARSAALESLKEIKAKESP